MNHDPNVLSVPLAAELLGCTTEKLRRDLKANPEYAAAIVIDQPGNIRISRPRLLRRLHGDEWQVVLNEAS